MVDVKNYKKDSEEKERLSFRLSGFNDTQRDYFQSTLGKVEDHSPTLALKRIINTAIKYKEEVKTDAIQEPIKELPNCGYAWTYQGVGAICINGLKAPISRTTLEKRKLGFLVCELCEMITKTKKVETVASKPEPITDTEEEEKTDPVEIFSFISDSMLQNKRLKNSSDYLPLFAERFMTLEPSDLVKLIYIYRRTILTTKNVEGWKRKSSLIVNEVRTIIAKKEHDEKMKLLREPFWDKRGVKP